MNKNIRTKYKIMITIIIILLALSFILKTMIFRYDINLPIKNYNINNESDSYLNYLKKYIRPSKLSKFIKNEYIYLDDYYEDATGNDVIIELYYEAYENLFIYLFNKGTINFDDCPVTDNFKKKYKIDLLDYFNLKESEDCNSNCLLNSEEKEVVVEVYGTFKNTEPTYWKTHHFHYILDNDGNVDDVIFDYTE